MHNTLNAEERLISIKDMANRFHVTTRTLRLYHDMDLLVPKYVDSNTGYRFYSSNQFPRMEKILQMKSIGLSLKQIKSILNTRDLSVFEALLNEQIDMLDEKISEFSSMRESLRKQLTSCSHLRNTPILNSAFIEFIPKRGAYRFDIEPYSLLEDFQGVSPWEKVVSNIREIFSQNKINSTFGNQICCSVSQKSLLNNEYFCNAAFVLGDNLPSSTLNKTCIQAGTYACLYRKYVAMENLSEYAGLKMLIDFIKENQYQIVGPYLGEIIAEASIFDYNDNNILVKMQIPVKITD